MPAPPVYSKASGMDIQATIQKLLELERIPVQRLQRDNQRNEVMIQAWEEVRTRSTKLANASRDLYSFSGPFARRGIISADPGAITGEASSRVELGRQEFQVLELASAHQIHSDPIGVEEDLPAGKFTIAVGEKTHQFEFPGGKLATLERMLGNRGVESYDLLRTRIDANRALLTLRSKASGKKGEFKFTDPDGLLRKIGLVKRPGENETYQDLLFAPEKVSRTARKEGQVPGGSFALLEGGKGLRVDGEGTMLYTQQIPANTELEFESQADYDPEKARRAALAGEGKKEAAEAGERKKLQIGPDIKFQFGGREFQAPQPERESALPVDNAPSPKDKDEKKPDDQPNIPDRGDFALGVRWRKGGKIETKEIFWTARGSQAERRQVDLKQITGGEPVESLFFHAGPGAALTVRNLRVKRTGAEGDLVAAHETRPARDARLNVNGVEVTRSANTGITDLIEGASINLHRPTAGPTEVKIQVNADDIIQKIKDWVTAYNDLMKFCRENSNVDVKSQRETAAYGQDQKDISEGMLNIKQSSGVFATDSTIRQLVAGIRQVSAGSYPSTGKPGYRVLDEIGVGTGAVGQNWKQIQYGYLELDENKLRGALETAPESVKELFASDTNEDSRVDNGVAFEMRGALDPYNQVARGLIATRIDLLKTQITDNKDKISKLEYSVANKEESLRRRFGRMESAVQNSQATSNFLRSKLGGAGQ